MLFRKPVFMSKITTLRKKKLLTESNAKGISGKFIADFKVNVPHAEQLSPLELKKKVIQSLARQMRQKIRSMETVQEVINFVDENVSFGSTKIDIQSLEEMEDTKKQCEIIKLLSHCTKVSSGGSYTFDNYEHVLPVMFNVNYYDVLYNRELEVEGYTFPKETLPKRFNSGSWRLGQGNSYSMRDLGTLSALVFFVNVMEEFIIANKDVYFYIVAKDYVNARSLNPNKEITIPEMDEYGDVIAKYINEFDLIPEGFKLVENEGENDRLHHFELEDHIVDGKIITFNREYIDKMILEFLESTNSLVIKVDQE